MTTKRIEQMTGYKATDKDMKCQGFQFELGKWYKQEGEIELCKTGFHFCKYPSGPLAYYSDTSTRIFKVEAKDAYEEYAPGADLKIVCREIRLIGELKPTGNRNTGYGNTGDLNTGYGNATDYSSGFFCQKEPCILSFDKQTKLTRKKYFEAYPQATRLAELLSLNASFDYTEFKMLPGWTLNKCKALHQKHINLRRKDGK